MRLPVILVVEETADLDTVRAACQQYGLADIREMRNIKLLSGVVESGRVKGLSAISGVHAIEQGHDIQLPRPIP